MKDMTKKEEKYAKTNDFSDSMVVPVAHPNCRVYFYLDRDIYTPERNEKIITPLKKELFELSNILRNNFMTRKDIETYFNIAITFSREGVVRLLLTIGTKDGPYKASINNPNKFKCIWKIEDKLDTSSPSRFTSDFKKVLKRLEILKRMVSNITFFASLPGSKELFIEGDIDEKASMAKNVINNTVYMDDFRAMELSRSYGKDQEKLIRSIFKTLVDATFDLPIVNVNSKKGK